MNLKDMIYFTRMSNYQPREIKNLPCIYRTDIDHFSTQIRTTAKEALSGDIPPIDARDNISDLVDLIKKLKKGKLEE